MKYIFTFEIETDLELNDHFRAGIEWQISDVLYGNPRLRTITLKMKKQEPEEDYCYETVCACKKIHVCPFCFEKTGTKNCAKEQCSISDQIIQDMQGCPETEYKESDYLKTKEEYSLRLYKTAFDVPDNFVIDTDARLQATGGNIVYKKGTENGNKNTNPQEMNPSRIEQPPVRMLMKLGNAVHKKESENDIDKTIECARCGLHFAKDGIQVIHNRNVCRFCLDEE